MYTLQRALEDSAKLIRRFSPDEEVAYDFTEENYLAKTRERDTDYPQVLVAPDRIWRASPDAMDISDQVVMSVLHEEAHLRGIQSEKRAEDWAYQKYRKESKSYVPRIVRRRR